MTEKLQTMAPFQTIYVDGEGRPSLEKCLAATFTYCRNVKLRTIVIYTSTGEGPELAIDTYGADADFSTLRLIAVTPPAAKSYRADPREKNGKTVRAGVVGDRRVKLDGAEVTIVSARLPFRSLAVEHSASDSLSATTDPMQVVDRAFGVLGGGFSLCIQAALMACDAGAVSEGERIAVMSADTALVVIASQSESFLTASRGLLVEHIICRPSLYDISKPEHRVTRAAQEANAAKEEPAQLLLPDVDEDD